MKKTIILFTLLTAAFSTSLANTKTNCNPTEIKGNNEISKYERLEDMMRRYQGE